MFRSTLITGLLILFTSLGFADNIIKVPGKNFDAYSDNIHMYVENKIIEIVNVPKDVIKKSGK